MYYSITSDTETSENSSHDCSEHNETNAHWRIFCSAKCTLAYIFASVNIVKIWILIVSNRSRAAAQS